MTKKNAFTLIELLVVVAILSLLILAGISTMMTQLTKGRDGKRKADLNKIQKALEDYMNDKNCYPPPAEFTFGDSFSPYLTSVPKDPLNNNFYNYFYSYDSTTTCKKWYKIYAKLENTNDPVIKKVDCPPPDGCGPSGNYNYWVASPNMNKVAQLPGELWWPEIGGGMPAPGGGTSTPTLTSPTSSPTPAVGPTSSPTPEPTSPLQPTSTPTLGGDCIEYDGCGWVCGILPLSCGTCCPGHRECVIVDLSPKCCYNLTCQP